MNSRKQALQDHFSLELGNAGEDLKQQAIRKLHLRNRRLIYCSRPTGESTTSRILPDEKLPRCFDRLHEMVTCQIAP